jgi:hypothetical protein
MLLQRQGGGDMERRRADGSLCIGARPYDAGERLPTERGKHFWPELLNMFRRIGEAHVLWGLGGGESR